MADLARYRDKRTGHHVTLTVGADSSRYTRLAKRPAVDKYGRPLPPKFAHVGDRTTPRDATPVGADTTTMEATP